MNREMLYKELEKQTEEMDMSERMKEYLQGREVDYQPFAFLAPDDALAYIWGFTKGDIKRSFDVRKEIIRRKKDEYGMKGISISLGLRGMGEAMGSELIFPENQVEYVDKFILTDYKDLDRLEQVDISKNPILLKKLEEGNRMLEEFPDMSISTDCAGPITTAIAVRPIEMVLRDMHRNPEDLHRLLQLCVNNSLKWVEMFFEETKSNLVGFADPVTTTDILGVKYFQEFSKPYLKQLMDGIEKITGNKPSVHICGHTKKIWDDLIEIGVNNFSIDNCECLNEAKSIMGKHIFLSGNVAPVEVLRNGSIDDVIHAVKSCILDGSDNPSGYMLMSGCQVPIGTPKENIDAYIYAARKYGKCAKLGELPLGVTRG